MASIRKRGGKYQVLWRGLDGVEHGRTCETAEAAQKLRRDIERTLDLGREWEPQKARARAGLEQVAEAYQDARRLRVRPSTLKNEGANLDLFLRFAGEQRIAYLDDLSRPVLDDFLGWLLRPETGRHGRPRQPGSAGRVVESALLLWRWAEDSGRYEDVPRAPHDIELPRAAAAPVVAPEWSEMDAAIAACGGWQKQLATWLRYSGLRAGESMLFLWSDIDLERGTLTIRRELDKNKVGRTVPLHPALLDEIATWGVREGYVIPTRRHADCKHHRDPRARDLRRAWKRAGIREAVWAQRPEHAFRRGIKSGLLQLGANPAAVRYLLGHKVEEGAGDRYIDPWLALPLRETIAMIPRIGEAAGNVVRLPSRGQGVDK